MQKTAKRIPSFTTGMVRAAVTTALLSPPSFAAPGDLDPAFGDVGRLGPILDGPVWSLEPQTDGSMLLGGGSPGFSYWGDWIGEPSFVQLVSEAGVTDPALAVRDFGTTQIVSVARQPDGKVIAAGRQVVYGDYDTRLVVIRLMPDGSRDLDFGPNKGSFRLSEDEHGYLHNATSVVLEPDGRIVVAGSRDDKLIVLRLLPDGLPDLAFATSGIFEGPANVDHSDGRSGARTNLLRTGGGYRVTTAAPEGCQVVALTADGALDAAFGNAGIATIAIAAGPTTYCIAMTARPDGRLLIAGRGNDRGFAARLLANGQPDPTFAADAVAAAMTRATAVAADGNAAVVVAGIGDDGVSVMRLAASGAPDATFGTAGTATFDLATESSAYPVINDLFVRADRRIVGAGGTCSPTDCWWADQAFVVRLLGDNGEAPGVVGLSEQFDIIVAEQDGEAILDVRRTGGRSGSVSVDWQTASVDWEGATPGTDYTEVSGTLTWADGNAAEQQIRVPILTDTAVEERELFQVVLSGHQDGAGLGKRRATVVIAPDGAPHGQFGFALEQFDTAEYQSAQVAVSRDYYFSGVVSVTVTPSSGTAIAGTDFVANPVTLNWQDGESGEKVAVIPILDDSLEENPETFTVTLSDATGGALIGPRSSASVRITGNDHLPSADVSGGGAFGWLSLLALGFLRWLRRERHG